MEAGMQTLAGTTEDHAAAVRAFLEKRPPRFNGR
jgi:enoyl-CoA hydratase/carnithine racemase